MDKLGQGECRWEHEGMRDSVRWAGNGMEGKSKEREVLMEQRAFPWCQGNSQESTRLTPVKNPLSVVERVHELAFPCNQIGDCSVIREPSSSNWWKQMQRSTAKHWAELWESC